MICSKIQRLTSVPLSDNKEIQTENVVVGICDYIPPQFKTVLNLNIWIQGAIQKIFNTVLWNQFYTKTLLKQCYYQIIQSFVSPDNNKANLVGGVFIRFGDKIHKLNEIMDWKSQVRSQSLASCKEQGELHIESFNNQAQSRKINIYFGIYPSTIPNLHFGLKITHQQGISKSIGQYHVQSKLCDSTSKKNGKHSLISQKSIKSKSSINKENNKTSKSALKVNTTPLTLKKEQKKKEFAKSDKKQIADSVPYSCKPNNGNMFSHSTLPEHFRQSLLSNYQPCTLPINRQSVMSKIITGKEEAIIHLKEQLVRQDQSYSTAMRQMHNDHQNEVQRIKSSVKQILNNYESSQKAYLNENEYLKDRVKVLEECLTDKEDKLTHYLREFQQLNNKQRQLQEELGRISKINQQLKVGQEQSEHHYKEQGIRQRDQIAKLKLDCNAYKSKYGEMVSTMKTFINLNDQH